MPDTLDDKIETLLREGLGAEDIAVRLDNSLDRVRHRIKIMRGDGRLAAIYPLKIDEAKK